MGYKAETEEWELTQSSSGRTGSVRCPSRFSSDEVQVQGGTQRTIANSNVRSARGASGPGIGYVEPTFQIRQGPQLQVGPRQPRLLEAGNVSGIFPEHPQLLGEHALRHGREGARGFVHEHALVHGSGGPDLGGTPGPQGYQLLPLQEGREGRL